MILQAGYQQQHLHVLNRCRLAHHIIFLSTTACRHNLDLLLLTPPPPGLRICCSSYVFPTSHPSRADWQLWLEFWMTTTGSGGLLHIPLGDWLHKTHRTWHWYYCKHNDTLYQKSENTITSITRTTARARVQSRQEYHCADDIDVLPEHCVPVDVAPTTAGTIYKRSIGPPLATTVIETVSF